MKQHRVGVNTTQTKAFIKESKTAVCGCSSFEVENTKKKIKLL